MEKLRWVLAGVVGLGLFSAGYLVRGSDAEKGAGGAESSTLTARRPNRQNPPESISERIRAKSDHKPADGEQAGYRKIVDMVSKGELQITGVDISNNTFAPGRKVAEFFDLSEEQIAEMKRLGLERLRKKQDHEQSLAKIQEVSETGMVFDLPADPEFAAKEAARFVEELGQAFGEDVAEMLQPSIRHAYRDFDAPRHIRYNITRRNDPIPEGAPKEIRAMYEGMYDYKISVNQNEDGSYMTGEQGQMLPGRSDGGAFNLNDTNPEAFRPPFHYLWEREMKRR